VAAWGYNAFGSLGDTTTTKRLAPVPVNTDAGVSALNRKTVVAIAAGLGHSLALCSDGTVAAWGAGGYGQLGDNAATDRHAPVAVNTDAGLSALHGKTVVAIAAGKWHSLALCADGTTGAWGYNTHGELGDNTTNQRSVPVAVNRTSLAASQRFAHVISSASAIHTLALVAGPPPAPITLTGAQTPTNGSFQFAFTNNPGAFFGVVATTNSALPLSNWTSLTGLTEVSAGQFQFTDPQATTMPSRFYRVQSA
jgi:hypothetical protein